MMYPINETLETIRTQPWFPWVMGILGLVVLGLAIFRFFRHLINLVRNTVQNSVVGQVTNVFNAAKKTVGNAPNDEALSLNAMDRIYLPQIAQDFPMLRVDQLGNQAQTLLLESYEAMNSGNTAVLEEKFGPYIKDSVDRLITQNRTHGIDAPTFERVRVHDRALSRYGRQDGKRLIEFQFATEAYVHSAKHPEPQKKQMRDSVRFQYLEDVRLYEQAKGDDEALALNCPNCGAPLSGTGIENCRYCGTQIRQLQLETWLATEIYPDEWDTVWRPTSTDGFIY